MGRISYPYIVFACVLAVVMSSALREYSKPIKFFKKQQRGNSVRWMDPINFRYAEESKTIFIHDMYYYIGQTSSLYVFQQQNNTFIQTNKIQLLDITLSSCRSWQVDTNAERIIWRINDGNIILSNSDNVPLSNLMFLTNFNWEVELKLSSDRKLFLLKLYDYNTFPFPTYIFSLENNSLQQISFQNNTQALAIITMNKKSGFIAINLQPRQANDTNHYVIKQFNFNSSSGLYEQNITVRSLIEKFDYTSELNLRLGQNDDFMVFRSNNQAIIIKKQNGYWVTKSRDIYLFPAYQRMFTSQNGSYIMILPLMGYPTVYQINQDHSNYEKVAVIDSLVDIFTTTYITNDGSIFISNFNDVYYIRLLPLSNQPSSSQEGKIIANASTIIQINTPPSTQTDNSIFILGSIFILILLTIIIICLMFKHLQSMKLKQENLSNKIMQQSSLVMGSSNRHEKKQQTIEIEVFQA